MSRTSKLLAAVSLAATVVLEPLSVHSQPPPWAGRHQGPAGDAARRADQDIFHYLLDHRHLIRRKVTLLPQGVETLTESDQPEVAEKLRQHVASMHRRMKEDRGIHMRDPLFAELFRHAAKISIVAEPTTAGLRVRQTSADPYVVGLIRMHADVVSLFLANGHAEVRKNHEPPR